MDAFGLFPRGILWCIFNRGGLISAFGCVTVEELPSKSASLKVKNLTKMQSLH